MATFCSICDQHFSNQHGLNVHLKGRQHEQRVDAIEANQARARRHEDRTNNVLLLRDQVIPLVQRLQEQIGTAAGQIIIVDKKVEDAAAAAVAADMASSQSDMLSSSILRHYERTRPNRKTMQMRRAFLTFVRDFILIVHPEARFVLYGSTVCGLDDDDSDLDLAVVVGNLSKPEEVKNLKQLLDILAGCNASNLNLYIFPKAVVPIISINETISGLQVDVSMRCPSDKLRLLQEYLKIDDRVRPYLKVIKDWAKSKDICNAIAGFINSFGYCCMAIAVLQVVDPPVLPNIQKGNGQMESGEDFRDFGKRNTMSLGQLVLEFFRVITAFDYKNLRISILHGGFAPKEPEKFIHPTWLCVEDPLDPYLNFSRHVTPETLEKIFHHMNQAKYCLESGGLTKDLLQKK